MIKKSMIIVVSGLLFSVTGSAIADGDAGAGETESAACAGCHGSDGLGLGGYPAIAGLDYQTLISKMAAYRSKEKEDIMMNMLFESMGDEEIADLASYFSSLAAD